VEAWLALNASGSFVRTVNTTHTRHTVINHFRAQSARLV
jgi:hypothetical protein